MMKKDKCLEKEIIQGTTPGDRLRGKPKTSWLGNIRLWTKQTMKELLRTVEGPSIKYVTLEGEGVRECVTVCDRGGGSRACDVTLTNFFILHNMKHEI